MLRQLTHGNNRESPPITLTADIFNSYFTKIGLDTVSHLQPNLATCVDGGESEFFGGDQTARCFNFTTIEQDSHYIKLDDVTTNDVLGFDSRLLFLNADIIAPSLTNFYDVSIETQSVSDWKLSKVIPIYTRERVARTTPVTIDLYVYYAIS